ncbi:MAG: hypothetical protein EXQ85_03475 [Alphaproteobacteria bacterium]|nr:hypothetical protein [Alphaproteobacteria bacterium]
MAHLPVFAVFCPFVGAALCLIIPAGARAIATAFVWIMVGLALIFLLQAINSGGRSYALGGWITPSGIALRSDSLSAITLLGTAVVAAAVPLLAHPALRSTRRSLPALTFAATLGLLGGATGTLLSGDLLTLAIFFETVTVAACALIAAGQTRRALASAFHVVVAQSTGTALVLMGIALIYAAGGSLDILDLAGQLNDSPGRSVALGSTFVVLGFVTKLALCPAHWWMTRIYCEAPFGATVLPERQPSSTPAFMACSKATSDGC